jgi:hypothetical protein
MQIQRFHVLALVAILLLAGAGFWWHARTKKLAAQAAGDDPTLLAMNEATATGPAPSSTPTAARFPLRQGMVSREVAQLQRYLNTEKKASPKLDVDGKFGPKTLSAVKQLLGRADGTVSQAYYDKVKMSAYAGV